MKFQRGLVSRIARLLVVVGTLTIASSSPAGSIFQWGNSAFGQLNGKPTEPGFVQVSARNLFSLALCADGSIVQWGNNNNGQTNGFPISNTDFVQVAAGNYHSIALKADGRIVQWGANNNNQLSNFPINNSGFIGVSAGSVHNIALKADGSIVQWGYAGGGQSNGFPTNNNNFVQAEAGGYHNVALRANGSIVQWGVSSNGQMNGFPTNNTGFVQVAAGEFHSIALKADGSIVQWGRAVEGQLNGFPQSNTGYIHVVAGLFHALAFKADGSIVQWGRTAEMQLNGFQPVGFVPEAAGGLHSIIIEKPLRPWSVTRLHPFGAIESSAYAVDGSVQGGYADYGSGWRATRWSGSNSLDLRDLGPGVVTALDGGREFGDTPGAVAWNGTEASKVALPVDWVVDSHVTDAGDGQVVGYGFDGNDSFDNMIWTGPPFVYSRLMYNAFHRVLGVGGGVQVGQHWSDNAYAEMWRGTPDSIYNLHPITATWSGAYGTDGVQQVGSAGFGGSGWYGGVEMAGFWTGTKDSWTLLHPIGATRSSALRVADGMQVGFAVAGGVQRASYWESSAGSWVNLGLSLPAEFAGMESIAKDIQVDGNTVTIVGDAINSLTGRREAVMWVSSAGAVDTTIDGNVDRFSRTLTNGATTLSRTLFLTMSGTADAGVDGFQYSVDGGALKHCGKSVFLTSLSLGPHTVEVRAIDTEASVDLTPALLTWTVITPAQAVSEMISFIQSQGLPNPIRLQLVTPLTQALNQLNSGNVSQAMTLLNNFKSKVSQLRNQNKLTMQQAQYLTDQANAVIASL